MVAELHAPCVKSLLMKSVAKTDAAEVLCGIVCVIERSRHHHYRAFMKYTATQFYDAPCPSPQSHIYCACLT